MARPASRSTAVSQDEEASDDWLRRVAALTVAPPSGALGDEIATATATAAALAANARELVLHGVVAVGTCAPGCAVCAAPDLGCDLVRDLAGTRLARSPHEPGATLEGYRRALGAAGAAVFTCRRTLHISDTCLFGDGDLCGRVLAAAHRLG